MSLVDLVTGIKAGIDNTIVVYKHANEDVLVCVDADNRSVLAQGQYSSKMGDPVLPQRGLIESALLWGNVVDMLKYVTSQSMIKQHASIVTLHHLVKQEGYIPTDVTYSQDASSIVANVVYYRHNGVANEQLIVSYLVTREHRLEPFMPDGCNKELYYYQAIYSNGTLTNWILADIDGRVVRTIDIEVAEVKLCGVHFLNSRYDRLVTAVHNNGVVKNIRVSHNRNSVTTNIDFTVGNKWAFVATITDYALRH